MIAPGRGSGLAIGLTYSEWPLLAESGHEKSGFPAF